MGMKYCTEDGKHIFNTVKEYDEYIDKIKEQKRVEHEKQIKIAELRTLVDTNLKALKKSIERYENASGKKLVYSFKNGEFSIHDRDENGDDNMGFPQWLFDNSWFSRLI